MQPRLGWEDRQRRTSAAELARFGPVHAVEPGSARADERDLAVASNDRFRDWRIGGRGGGIHKQQWLRGWLQWCSRPRGLIATWLARHDTVGDARGMWPRHAVLEVRRTFDFDNTAARRTDCRAGRVVRPTARLSQGLRRKFDVDPSRDVAIGHGKTCVFGTADKPRGD